jgi:hypothetical protein
MKESLSRYHKLPLCDGLEALYVTHYNTPFPFHYHPTFNVSLIYEGIFQTQLNDRLITAPTGAILITNPGEIHANPFEKGNSVSFFTFYLAQDFMTHCNEGKPVFFDKKAIYDPDLFGRLHQLSMAVRKSSPTGNASSAKPSPLEAATGDHGEWALKMEKKLCKAFHLLAAKHGAIRRKERAARRQPCSGSSWRRTIF